MRNISEEDRIKEDSPEWWEKKHDLFSYLYRDYRVGENCIEGRPHKLYECGGHMFDDTPVVLYRALQLTQPKTLLNFSDMYKTGGLLMLYPPDGTALMRFELWHHQAGVAFACRPEMRSGEISGIQMGDPDADNGVRCADELTNRWFQLGVKALSTPWRYPGGFWA